MQPNLGFILYIRKSTIRKQLRYIVYHVLVPIYENSVIYFWLYLRVQYLVKCLVRYTALGVRGVTGILGVECPI